MFFLYFLLIWSRFTPLSAERFNIQDIIDLPPFSEEMNFLINKRFIVISYFSNLSCNTCLNRELKYINRWSKRAHEVSFLCIAKSMYENYTRNLIRIGRVKYPILIADDNFRSGLAKGEFCLSFIDLKTNKIVFQMFPAPGDPKRIHLFEEVISKYIKENG